MSLLVASQLTAIATAVLGAGAIVTAVFAILAFRKQAQEVRTLQQEADDQQELTRQQGELLKLQSGQLDVQRQQLADQQQINRQQAAVLELELQELQASLAQRKRDFQSRRQPLASRVYVTQERVGSLPRIAAHVHNKSDQPIYDVAVQWHRGAASWGNPNPESLPPVLPHADFRTDPRIPRGHKLR